MKLISPNVELIHQESGLEGIYKQIERVGRTCYKSEDRITEDSVKSFGDRMIAYNHLTMTEHGSIYLQTTMDEEDIAFWVTVNSYYSHIVTDVSNHMLYVITNLKVLIETRALRFYKLICMNLSINILRVCLKFITSIGVSKEFNRHHRANMGEMSTRYCNFSKDKFCNGISFIIPSWLNPHCPNKEQKGPSYADIEWSKFCGQTESSYFIRCWMETTEG